MCCRNQTWWSVTPYYPPFNESDGTSTIDITIDWPVTEPEPPDTDDVVLEQLKVHKHYLDRLIERLERDA